MVYSLKKWWLVRDFKLRQFFQKFEVKKKVLKCLLYSMSYCVQTKMYFLSLFHKITKKASLGCYRSGCIVSGLGNSISRKTLMSRHDSKFKAAFGFLVGFRKSSF